MSLDRGMLGNFNFSGGPSGGFSRSLNVGLNMSRDIGPKSNLNGSYFVGHVDSKEDRTSFQQQVLGSGIATLSDITSNRGNNSLHHMFDLNARINLGPSHDLRIRSDIRLGASSMERNSTESTVDPESAAQVGVITDHTEDSDELEGEISLVWRKRLSEGGPSIVLEGDVEASRADALGDLNSHTRLATLGDLQTDEELRQRQEENSGQLGHSQRLSYTQPLSGGLTLEAFGRHRVSIRDRDKAFQDLVDGRLILNPRLSESFEQTYRYWAGGVELNFNPKTEVWISGGLTLERTGLEGTIVGARQEITSNYFNLLPWVRYRHRLAEGTRVQFRYRTRQNVPSVTQLQPYTNNVNPLRIYVGNPDLEPSITHSFGGEFNTYDQFSFVGYSAGFSVGVTQNDIVSTRDVDAQLRQIRSTTNSGALSWNTSGRAGFSAPIRPLGIAIDLSNSLFVSEEAEFINGVENTNRQLRNTLGIEVKNRTVDLVEVNVGAKVTYNRTSYSLNTEANQTYINSFLSSNIAWYVSDKFRVEVDGWYRIFDQDAFRDPTLGSRSNDLGRQENILRVDFTVSHLLMNDRAEVSLDIIDVFDQNSGVSYTNTASYVRTDRVAALGRYIMLKFIYRPRGKGGGLFGML